MANRESPSPETAEKSRRAEASLSALIESTEDLIWSVDLDYRLINFNHASAQNIEDNFGVTVAEGQRLQDLLPQSGLRFGLPSTSERSPPAPSGPNIRLPMGGPSSFP